MPAFRYTIIDIETKKAIYFSVWTAEGKRKEQMGKGVMVTYVNNMLSRFCKDETMTIKECDNKQNDIKKGRLMKAIPLRVNSKNSKFIVSFLMLYKYSHIFTGKS
ncbi:hypothetical protein C0J52_28008 [Blattella germanica]|nr:hypothetical protein C0J52_28008 [Blattella germanica]